MFITGGIPESDWANSRFYTARFFTFAIDEGIVFTEHTIGAFTIEHATKKANAFAKEFPRYCLVDVVLPTGSIATMKGN